MNLLSRRLHNVWDSPEKTMKANVSMKSVKGNYANGCIKNDWDIAGDIIMVKYDMNIEKKFDPAKRCVSKQTAPKKKTYFPGKISSGFNRKNKKSKILWSKTLERNNGNYARVDLFCIHIHRNTQPHTVSN